MNAEKRKEILSVLKSKKFTIIYTDNGVCSLYKDRFSMDTVTDWEDKIEIFEFGDTDGYTPDIVCFLVAALGGNVESF